MKMNEYIKNKTIELLKEFEQIEKDRSKRIWSKDREKSKQHIVKAGEISAIIGHLEKS